MEHYSHVLHTQQDFAEAASLDACVIKIRVTRTLTRTAYGTQILGLYQLGKLRRALRKQYHEVSKATVGVFRLFLQDGDKRVRVKAILMQQEVLPG
jgi:hypothetical protein